MLMVPNHVSWFSTKISSVKKIKMWKKTFNLTLIFSQGITLIFFNRTTPKTEANTSTVLQTSVNFQSKTLVIRFSRLLTSKRRFFFHVTQVSPLWRTPTSKLRVFHVKKIKAETESANRRQTESRAAYVKGASQHQLLFCVCGACVNWEAWYTFWLSNVCVLKMKFEFFWEKRSENDEREAIESIQNLLWKIEKNWEKSMIFHLCHAGHFFRYMPFAIQKS